jgi:hypothetical protein
MKRGVLVARHKRRKVYYHAFHGSIIACHGLSFMTESTIYLLRTVVVPRIYPGSAAAKVTEYSGGDATRLGDSATSYSDDKVHYEGFWRGSRTFSHSSR